MSRRAAGGRAVRIDFAAVRERHPLAEVARRSGYSIGEEGGDVFVACPMPDHEDRTPSMLLHLDAGRYHCFGCGASGDVVQWVRDVYRVDAHEAVELLESTQRPFLPPPGGVPAGGGEIRRQRRGEQPDLERTSAERVRAALAEAWRYYTLPQLAERASEYLAHRGIHVAALGVMAGHTPYNPDQLVMHLRRRGFADDELVDAGLAYRRAGEPVRDAYIRRVVVPVRDERGGLVGLIGRSTAGDGRAPKYVNSATTVLYDKSRALFDPVRRGDLAGDGQVVVVEGVMDALAIAAAAHAVGAGERFRPVATSGVAFSDGQIDRILALHPRAPVIALDGDPGGRRAAAQLAARMAQRGREATITTWPAGEDPASWLGKHGPGALSAITRAGCLDAEPGGLRPHHGGREAATELMAAADTLRAKVSAALEPARKMPPAAVERYVVAAARAIAPVVVTAAASAPMGNRGRIENVIEAVTRYGAQLPTGAEASYVEAAVQSIEAQELAPGMWAEREIKMGVQALRALEAGQDETPSAPQPRGVMAPAVPGPRKPPGGPERAESARESARLARAGQRQPPSAATRSARPGGRATGAPQSAVMRPTAGARRGR